MAQGSPFVRPSVSLGYLFITMRTNGPAPALVLSPDEAYCSTLFESIADRKTDDVPRFLRPVLLTGATIAHLSTSPNTMSIEPRMAETSASMWPRQRKSIACRCAKPGARILHLYGLLVPSETR